MAEAVAGRQRTDPWWTIKNRAAFDLADDRDANMPASNRLFVWNGEMMTPTHVTDAGTHAEGKRAIVAHLNALVPLDDNEQTRLLGGIGHFREWRPNEVLIAPGAELTEPVFIVSGWAGRVLSLMDGRRQVIDFYIPGDLMGFASRTPSHAKAQYVCLTHVTTSDARDLVRIVRDDPAANARLATALASRARSSKVSRTRSFARAPCWPRNA